MFGARWKRVQVSLLNVVLRDFSSALEAVFKHFALLAGSNLHRRGVSGVQMGSGPRPREFHQKSAVRPGSHVCYSEVADVSWRHLPLENILRHLEGSTGHNPLEWAHSLRNTGRGRVGGMCIGVHHDEVLVLHSGLEGRVQTCPWTRGRCKNGFGEKASRATRRISKSCRVLVPHVSHDSVPPFPAELAEVSTVSPIIRVVVRN